MQSTGIYLKEGRFFAGQAALLTASEDAWCLAAAPGALLVQGGPAQTGPWLGCEPLRGPGTSASGAGHELLEGPWP